MEEQERDRDLLRYETHAHTAEISRCAKMPAALMVRQVKEAGYDALVVTDHFDPEFFDGCQRGPAYRSRLEDFFAGYRAAAEEGRRLGLLVLPALELRNVFGMEDFLIYGLTQEELGEMDCPCFLPLNRTLSLVRQAGGLLFQAHPFREYLRCMPAACMDGVEVVNANPRHDSHNDRALAFARENGLLRVAGSDVHQLGDAGAAGILAPYARDGKALAELLRQGRHRCFQRERGVERRV